MEHRCFVGCFHSAFGMVVSTSGASPFGWMDFEAAPWPGGTVGTAFEMAESRRYRGYGQLLVAIAVEQHEL